MKVTMEMPAVQACGVEECVFNQEKNCMSKAITVGDGILPECDTYFVANRHARESHRAGVGACKVSGCRFNRDYACQADAIIIGHISNKAHCKTFSPI